MAKIRNSFTTHNTRKQPVAGALGLSPSGLSKTAVPRDASAKIQHPVSVGSITQPRKFGKLHTNTTSAASGSGSQWTSLLNAASGGASSLLGGGLLASGGFGIISKLFGLFGGGKPIPVTPVAFQSTVPRQDSLNVTLPGSASSVSLGVHAQNPSANAGGAYQQTGSVVADHAAQSAQVIQIVKQALLTSSTLNDVIAEI